MYQIATQMMIRMEMLAIGTATFKAMSEDVLPEVRGVPFVIDDVVDDVVAAAVTVFVEVAVEVAEVGEAIAVGAGAVVSELLRKLGWIQ
jgi:hypothetical protein